MAAVIAKRDHFRLKPLTVVCCWDALRSSRNCGTRIATLDVRVEPLVPIPHAHGPDIEGGGTKYNGVESEEADVQIQTTREPRNFDVVVEPSGEGKGDRDITVCRFTRNLSGGPKNPEVAKSVR